MARINTYSTDTTVQKNDKLLGSNADGTTRNFSIEDIGAFQANTNSAAVIGQLPYVYHNNSFGGSSSRQAGSITINTTDATTAFSSITTLKVSKTPNGYENDVVAVLTAFLNKDIIISSNDDPNKFATYKCTAVTQDSSETDFYDLSLTYITGNGSLEVGEFYSTSRDISTSDNTTYDISIPSGTTSIRLTGSDSTTDNVAITGSGGVTVSRTSANAINIEAAAEQYTGTVTSVSGTGTVSGLTLSGTVTSSGSLTLGGSLSLTSSQITTGLGFTPYNSTNPSGYTSFAEPGIFAGGGSPSLASGVTAAEVRTLIGAGTSSLALGTSSSTALAGDTTTISSSQASAISANTSKVSDTGIPAILSDGSSPTLNTGITAAEVRTLIGAGTSSTTGTVTGTGTTNYLSKFTGSSAIGDSLVFDNGTNVGIGTTSPSEKLTVAGNISGSGDVNIVGDVTASAFVGDGSALTNIAPAGSDTEIQFNNAGALGASNNLSYSNGVLEIGYIGGAHTKAIQLFGTDRIIGTDGSRQIRLYTDRVNIGRFGGVVDAALAVKGSGATSATTALLVENSSGADLLKVTDDGFIYGTSTVKFGQGLHVERSGPSVSFKTTNNAAASGLVFQNSGGSTTARIYHTPDTGKIDFWPSNGGSKMNLTTAGLELTGSLVIDGNVGIGTTSPGEKLHIASTTTPTLKIEDTTNNSTIEVAAGNFDSTIETSGRLFINGSTTLAVSSSAVGVGVSSPTLAKLQVKGSGSTSSSTALLIQNSATTNMLKVDNDGRAYFYESTEPEHLRIIGSKVTGSRSSGASYANSIDFGTNSMNIKARSNISQLINGVSKLIVSQDYIKLDENTSVGAGANPSARLQVRGSGATSSTSSLLIQNSATTELFRVRDDGNVGIGTASPALQSAGTGLHINATTSSELKFTNSTTGTGAGDGTALVSNVNNFFINNREAGYMTLGTSNTERMRITSAGNVGIGTTSPAQKLHINGNFLLENNNEIRQKDSGGTQRTIIELDSSNDLNIGGSYSGALKFIGGGSYTEQMRIHDDGNVGIGTTSPNDKLDIVHTTSNLLGLNYGTNQLRFAVDNRSHIKWAGSSGTFYLSGRGNGLFIGSTSSDASARLHVKGSGTTSSTDALLIENSSGTELFRVRNDGNVYGVGAGGIDTNAAYGKDALISNTAGTFNTAVGTNSLQNNTGSFNTAFGAYTLNTNTTGTNNVAVGINSLRLNTTGAFNTAVGREASYDNTTGASNTSIGYQASMNNATGSSNTAIGRDSLRNNTASNNTAVGFESLKTNTTGASNVAIGRQAMLDLTTGGANVAIGYQAAANATTPNNNVAIGRQAGFQGTVAASTVYVGGYAGYGVTGSNNVAVGLMSQFASNSGVYNTSLGNSALKNNTSSFNTAMGHTALQSNTTASNNTAVGYISAYSNTTGQSNSSFGSSSLTTNQTGTRNNAFGVGALRTLNGGTGNAGFGNETFRSTTTGSHNVGIGDYAGYYNTTGSGNIGIGYRATFANTAGNHNVAIGYQALTAATTGSYNIGLGYATDSGGFNESVILGRSATATASNQFVVGSSSYSAGAITTETITADKTWTVKINGTDYKIPIVAA